MSVMEMSHRGADFGFGHRESAEADLRTLLAVPSNYRVLFLQGGAYAQNAAVPLNLLAPGGVPVIVVAPYWAQKSIAEARKYGRVNVAASSADAQYTYVPPPASWQRSRDASYVHGDERDDRRRPDISAFPTPATCRSSPMRNDRLLRGRWVWRSSA